MTVENRSKEHNDNSYDSENTPKTFGSLLREKRRSKRLSQVALGIRSHSDNTTISRYETGRQLPNRDDFNRLATALQLSTIEKEEWSYILQQDILQNKSIPSELYLSPSEIIDLSEELVTSVRTLRLLGKPQMAAKEAVKHARWMRILLERARTETFRFSILRSLAYLLMEESKSYMDYVPSNEAWTCSKTIIREQRKIATQLTDPQIAMLADISTEAALYVSGNYEKAHVVCLRILEKLDDLDVQWQVELLRASAINAGYLGDEPGLYNIAKSIDKLLEGSALLDTNMRSFMLEGVARGLGALKNPQALPTVEKAWLLINHDRKQDIHSSLRTVQLIRTQLKVMQNIGDINVADFEKIGIRGIVISEELGYLRYSDEINSILNAIL